MGFPEGEGVVMVYVNWPEKLRLAKIFLNDNEFLRCFSEGYNSLIPVKSASTPTMASDKYGRLYWNPEFVEKASVFELAFCLLHEVGHVFGLHFDRLKYWNDHYLVFVGKRVPGAKEVQPLDPKEDITQIPIDQVCTNIMSVPNIGGDIEIHCRLFDTFNDIFKNDQRFIQRLKKLQEHLITHEYFAFEKHLPAEKYCELLIKKFSNPGGGRNKQLQELVNKILSQRGYPSTTYVVPSDQSSSNGKGKSIPQKSCGSSSDDNKRQWDLSDNETDQNGDQVRKLSDAEKEALRQRIAENVKEYSKSRGNTPGGWDIWADSVLDRSKFDYKNMVMRKLRAACIEVISGLDDRSYRKLYRRHQSKDVILPGWVQWKATAAVLVDTSGSMGNPEIGTAVKSEVHEILKLFDNVSVIIADCEVNKVYKNVKNFKSIEWTGGGGTSHIPAFEAALELKPKPNVLLVLTDCITEWPKHDPGIPTLVLSPVSIDESSRKNIPSWVRGVYELNMDKFVEVKAGKEKRRKT